MKVETLFYGKNLCNLISVLIIEEFNSIDENHSTKLGVFDFDNFLIIKGKTTINQTINFSNLIKTKLSELYDFDITKNVIDLISYNTKPSKLINIEVTFDKKTLYQETTKDIKDKNKQGFVISNDLFNLNLTNNKNINENIDNDDSFLIDDDNLMYSSDSFYGQDYKSESIIIQYFMLIAHNIFDSNLCKDISFSLYCKNIEDFNNENFLFEIKSKTNITSLNWLKSLILDLYPLNFKEINDILSPYEFDFKNQVEGKNYIWKKITKKGEIILH